jgi:hypothetical protein
MVPNSIALAIRTGSRPVIPEKLAQITKRPVAPSENAQVGCSELDAGRKSDTLPGEETRKTGRLPRTYSGGIICPEVLYGAFRTSGAGK